jgi:hypothetical protein
VRFPLVFLRATVSNKYLLLTLLLATAQSGCGNSCFVFVSNPGGGSFPPGVPSCSVAPAKTNIRVRVGSSPLPEQNADRSRIEHIFVTVQGIEASSSADENVSNWQELAPNLVKNPLLLDLLGRSDSCGSGILDSASVPADVYRQLRFDLLPDQPDSSEPGSVVNACGRAVMNCLVTSDGEVRRLSIGNTEARISSASRSDGSGILPSASG